MNCPRCSIPLKFESLQTTQKICVHCAPATAIDSVLQIGTFGEVHSQSFKIIGYKKNSNFRISWLEWLILFEDTSLAWIKETRGAYCLFRFDAPQSELDLERFAPGDQFMYGQKKYILANKRHLSLEAQCGEALIQSNIGDQSLVYEAYEFSAPQKRLHVENYGSASFFSRGEFVEFNDLKLQNLKTVEGSQRIQRITCPSCSASFLIRFKSFSLRAVCNTCFSIIDISSDDHMNLAQFDRENRFEPTIPIGSQGKILGESFEVIGCMRLVGQADGVLTKYLLFSPTKSYRWLSDERGHWTISRVVNDLSTSHEQKIEYRGQTYVHDHKSKLRISFAIGEFYWPIQKAEVFETEHFIYPPYELVFEKNNDDPQIYLGRYLSPHQVSAAFKLVKTLGPSEGSVPHEVSPYHHLVKEFLLINLIFLAACFFVQLKNVKTAGVRVHHSFVHLSTEENLQSSEPFELRGFPSALEVSISAAKPREIEISLNEIRSKKKYLFRTSPFGPRALLPSIPPGVYYLGFSRISSQPSDNQTFEVNAIFGAKSWSNFYIAAIILSFPSFFIFAMDQLFEFKRKRKN